MKFFLYIIAGLIAYCLGSISTGILVSRFTHGPDLRKVGSGNTGATNVQRTMGWKYGLGYLRGRINLGDQVVNHHKLHQCSLGDIS